MTDIPEDVMKAAREAAASAYEDEDFTREHVCRIRGGCLDNYVIVRAAARAIMAERERAILATREECAKVAEAMPKMHEISPNHVKAVTPQDVAAAIRALGSEKMEDGS
jgi:hypothetical protein